MQKKILNNLSFEEILFLTIVPNHAIKVSNSLIEHREDIFYI